MSDWKYGDVLEGGGDRLMVVDVSKWPATCVFLSGDEAPDFGRVPGGVTQFNAEYKSWWKIDEEAD